MILHAKFNCNRLTTVPGVAHWAKVRPLVKEALIEIGCIVTSLVVGRWLVITRVHCGQTVHPRPIVTMKH